MTREGKAIAILVDELRLTAMTLLIALASVAARADQVTSTSKTSSAEFDVASIRRSESNVTSGGFRRLEPGIVVVSGYTLNELIEYSFDLRPSQLQNSIKWMNSERYDISAKDTSISTGNPRELNRTEWTHGLAANYPRLTRLIQDRFHLKYHIQPTEVRGLKLTLSGKHGPPPAPCEDHYFLSRGLAKGHIQVSSLAAALSHDLSMPIVDSTQLRGCYDINIKWTQNPEDSETPSIGQALGSLGFRLQKQKVPSTLFIIDGADRPTLDSN